MQSRDYLRQRSRTLAAVRRFFDQRGFFEIDTPLAIVANAPELHIEPVPLELRHSLEQGAAPHPRFLHTSPELAMKGLLAKGLHPIYQLCHVFRDGDWTAAHRPEFMLLEWYRARPEQRWLFEDCEALLCETATAINGEPMLYHGETAIPLAPPFRRYTVDQLFEKHCNITISQTTELAALQEQAQHILGRRLEPMPWDDLFNLLWLEKIAPVVEASMEPYFVHAWPAPLASLARLDPANQKVAMRVELYLGPMELANGFVELTDPATQRQRFVAEETARRARGLVAQPLNEDFLHVLENMPAAVGMALGFDRLCMLLTGARDIGLVMP